MAAGSWAWKTASAAAARLGGVGGEELQGAEGGVHGDADGVVDADLLEVVGVDVGDLLAGGGVEDGGVVGVDVDGAVVAGVELFVLQRGEDGGGAGVAGAGEGADGIADVAEILAGEAGEIRFGHGGGAEDEEQAQDEGQLPPAALDDAGRVPPRFTSVLHQVLLAPPHLPVTTL